MAVSQELLNRFITEKCWSITLLWLHACLPGANELIPRPHICMVIHHAGAIWIIVMQMWTIGHLSLCHFSRPETHLSSPGVHVTNNFSFIIQIWLNIRLSHIHILMQWLPQNFAPDTTAVLLCHVQNTVAISWLSMELWWNKIFVKRELCTKIFIEIGPRTRWFYHDRPCMLQHCHL